MIEQLKILLADDDKDDRYFFELALKEVPLPSHLEMVEDGDKLIKFLTLPSHELPDVIFIDLNMPRKNGGEALMEIKRNKKLEHIPTVIYSTSLHEDIADVLYQNGAHYYLQKPNFSELSGAINKILITLMNNPERPPRNSFIVNSLVT